MNDNFLLTIRFYHDTKTFKCSWTPVQIVTTVKVIYIKQTVAAATAAQTEPFNEKAEKLDKTNQVGPLDLDLVQSAGVCPKNTQHSEHNMCYNIYF